MLKIDQLRADIIKPALEGVDLWSEAAENLIVGTGLVESRYEFVRQWPSGPAMGFWQMEKTTHDWLWSDYLQRPTRIELAKLILPYISSKRPAPDDLEDMLRVRDWLPDVKLMCGNASYAAIMCRLKYYTIPAALPEADDVEGLAFYWKKYYNTEAGAGKPDHFVEMYNEHGR